MKQVARSKCTLAQNLKKNRILHEILRRNQVSRSELCGITGLSAPVMSRLTGELITEGLVVEEGVSPARDEVGRRGVLLGLNKSARYVVGVDVGASETKIVVCNLGGEIISKKSLPTSHTSDALEFINYIAQAITETVTAGRLDLNNVDCVTLAVPGSISPEDNKVATCNIPAMKGIELDKPLEKILKSRVKLTSSSSAWALGECEQCHEMGEKPDFLLANCGFGVFLMPFIGGKSVFARQSIETAKFDFGHIVLAQNGPKCHCGQSGCIEAYCSGWAIARDAQKNPSALLLDLVDGEPTNITAKDAFDSAKRGDSECLQIIRKAGMVYGRWLSTFVQFYMPKRVIFGGHLVDDSQFYYDVVIKEMQRHIPESRRQSIIFQRTALDKYRSAKGAASIAIGDLLNEKVEDMVEMVW